MFHEIWEVLEEVAAGHSEHPGFASSIDLIKGMHIGLEETEALMEGAGFDKSYVYARHRLTYVDPEFAINDIPYAGCWKVTLPEDDLPRVVEELTERLTGMRGDKGFRATWYVIIAYGSKP